MKKALSAPMQFLGLVLRHIAQMLQAVGDMSHRGGDLLHGFLPVLCSPAQLSEFVRAHYRTVYPKFLIQQGLEQWRPTLDPWEREVLDRYQIASGRMLILGCGWGREAVAIAQRGVMAIGVDTSPIAVQFARRLAARHAAPALFHLADFLKPPYRPASFDAALLSAHMYSAIPGTAQRQAWLSELGRLLKPGGLLILSFVTDRPSGSRLSALVRGLRGRLARLPGANRAYQPGDSCEDGCFLHSFQREEEISQELVGAGFSIRQLDWAGGYAVVSSARPASASGLPYPSLAAEAGDAEQPVEHSCRVGYQHGGTLEARKERGSGTRRCSLAG